MEMDESKALSRGISADMSPAAIERRLEIVDELRELSMELAGAKWLGPVQNTAGRVGTPMEVHSWEARP